jgi:DNA modification methylase
MSMRTHRIVIGDSRQMPELPEESVHLVVTSPPYWCIKDYGCEGQIGYDQSYEDYLHDLTSVLSECHRVLCPGCRTAVNIGDQYLRASEHGRYRAQPIPADVIQIGRKVGFDFMGNIIWEKISTTKTTGGGSWMGSIYYPKDGHVTYEHEYIILFRKTGQWPRPSAEQQKKSRLTKEERSRWFRGIWRIKPEKQNGHGAMFPVEVPRRLVRMYSFWGETVLDPFLGSGTTTLAAEMTGRNSVGFEVNPDVEPVVRQKVGGGTLTSRESRITFERRSTSAQAVRHRRGGGTE